MRRTLLMLAFVPLAAVTAHGHHSFAAVYYEEQTVSIAGELVEFDYRSPHSWVRILAVDKDGQARKINAEWASTNRLAQAGVSKDTLRPGDRLVISGSPSRDPSDYRMHLKGIRRPADGWSWNR